ncbi:hypothetical protein BH11MYX1_BH11MYX1_27040 [soil metagenome]
MMKTILTVAGMSCGSCVRKIERALVLEGVANVAVDLAGGSVTVEHDDRVGDDRLIAALDQAGYPVQPSREDRPVVRAGCCSGARPVAPKAPGCCCGGPR